MVRSGLHEERCCLPRGVRTRKQIRFLPSCAFEGGEVPECSNVS